MRSAAARQLALYETVCVMLVSKLNLFNAIDRNQFRLALSKRLTNEQTAVPQLHANTHTHIHEHTASDAQVHTHIYKYD